LPETSSFLLLCLGVGLCKTLLTLGATPPGKEEPFQPTWTERLSYPFLAWALFLLLFWPGTLSRPFLVGGLRILAGLGVLCLAFLFMDRARLLEGFLLLRPDPWLPPRGVLPMGVGWGPREEFLCALVLGTCGAALVSGMGALQALRFLGLSWGGLFLPSLLGNLGASFLKSRKDLGTCQDLPCCYLRPRFFRAMVGLCGLALTFLGAWSLGLGLETWVPRAGG